MLYADDREYITKKLTEYKSYIDLNNKLGFYDFAKDCENIFCEIFNIMYGTNFKNLNFQNCRSNYPAIDLADSDRSWYIQVTSNTTKGKIKDTLEKFKKYNPSKTFSRLEIFVLSNNKLNKIDGIDRIFGFTELIGDMSNLNQQKIDDIRKILDRALNIDSSTNLLIYNAGKKGNDYSKYIGWELKGYLNDEVITELKGNIDYFYEELNRISKDARELIYIVSTKCPLQKNERTFKTVCFNGNSLFSLYSNEKQKRKIEQLLSALDSAGHYREFEDGWGNRLCEFTFPCSKDSYDYDILYSFIQYSKNNNINLYKLIVDIEFSLLDR